MEGVNAPRHQPLETCIPIRRGARHEPEKPLRVAHVKHALVASDRRDDSGLEPVRLIKERRPRHPVDIRHARVETHPQPAVRPGPECIDEIVGQSVFRIEVGEEFSVGAEQRETPARHRRKRDRDRAIRERERTVDSFRLQQRLDPRRPRRELPARRIEVKQPALPHGHQHAAIRRRPEIARLILEKNRVRRCHHQPVALDAFERRLRRVQINLPAHDIEPTDLVRQVHKFAAPPDQQALAGGEIHGVTVRHDLKHLADIALRLGQFIDQ